MARLQQCSAAAFAGVSGLPLLGNADSQVAVVRKEESTYRIHERAKKTLRGRYETLRSPAGERAPGTGPDG
ncbi:hypothetical protein I7I53_10861 [Histoplasma capsulatum var. duboisii H88]|uniref:Uncharacterized protein n=1 Tax=Ajellomyces capsulatus (strain H88) TaxID=544711 RepID=A0A8A1LE11_AJEC8|nr:hypothetical protein I7I53_10861 [Histoplasma capsulatum var. duboisii H88]